mmetsp:Transcript_2726/g.6552  ORF Transcript_2726/g.6552 Transcript_2726/m.6552 type:complete len:472 (+) Transcript_2726:1-1416(+)
MRGMKVSTCMRTGTGGGGARVATRWERREHLCLCREDLSSRAAACRISAGRGGARGVSHLLSQGGAGKSQRALAIAWSSSVGTGEGSSSARLPDAELAQPIRPAAPTRAPAPRKPEAEEESGLSLGSDVELLSASPGVLSADLERAQGLLESGRKVSVQVLKLNQAGLVCKFSDMVEAFAPVAQLSQYTRQLFREEWLSRDGGEPSPDDRSTGGFTKKRKGRTLVGENIDVCVIAVRDEIDHLKGKHRVILSERKAEELDALEVFNVTHVGDVVECYVKSVTHFGIFVKLGAVDALIHKSQIWLPEESDQDESLTQSTQIDESKLSSSFALGDRLKAAVVKVDKAKGQISLSLKELVPGGGKLTLGELADEMKKAGNDSKSSNLCEIPEFLQWCSVLDGMEEIDRIIPGPCLKSGAVAPEFQVLLSSEDVIGGYEVFARKGFNVQEAQIQTNLEREELKRLLQSVSANFEC